MASYLESDETFLTMIQTKSRSNYIYNKDQLEVFKHIKKYSGSLDFENSQIIEEGTESDTQ